MHPYVIEKNWNTKGTGVALRISPRWSSREAGIVILELAPQSKAGEDSAFDYSQAAVVTMNPLEIVRLVRVLKGYVESYRTSIFGTIFSLEHLMEPEPSYKIAFEDEASHKRRVIYLTPEEGDLLCSSLSYVIGPLVFGVA